MSNINIAGNWNQSFSAIQRYIDQFNNSFQSSKKIQELEQTYQEEALENIYQLVEQETNRLKDLSKLAQSRLETIGKRLDKLESGNCCCTLSGRAVVITAVLAGFAALFGIAGLATAAASDEPISKWTGFGVGTVSLLFTCAVTVYGTKVSLISNEEANLALEKAELVSLNQQGVEQAETFKKLIKNLKDIKQIQKAQLQQLQEQSKVSQLDEKISDCLNQYEDLGKKYKNNEVYFRLLSLLIHCLPDEDPIKADLESFNPIESSRVKNLTDIAEKPLEISYLPQDNESGLNTGKEKSKWTNEEQNHENCEIVIDSLQSKQESAKKVTNYKHLVANRFGIHKDIPFFELSSGWRLTSEGKYVPISMISSTNQLDLQHYQITVPPTKHEQLDPENMV